jgi:flagellar hook-associated protein 3 FlgL
MTISVGDAAQQFTSSRTTGSLKSELFRLTQSLSTGKTTDLTQKLEGQTERFSSLKYSLGQLAAYQKTNIETAQHLAGMQAVLGQVDSVRGAMAERLLLVNESSTNAQVDEAAQSSRSAFETVVSAMNTRIADRALFGGAAVKQAPLAPAADMLAEISTSLAGLTDATSIIAAVDAWFDDPLIGFPAVGYLGNTGPAVEKRISDTQSITVTARADEPGVVDVLKATALAAIASELPALGMTAKTEILTRSGESLFAGATDLTAIQATLGFSEGTVSDAIAENSAQITAFSILQNDIVSVDPFETATELQAVQLQLETHFSMIGRLSQLSLLRYI